VTFASPNATDTQASFSAVGSYVVRLTASDGALSSSDTVAVTATAAITTVPAPVITPAAGTYYGSVSVSISNSLSGAEIRYTTDGSAVTVTSPVYTVRAKAYKSGLTESSQVSAAYTIAAVPPRVTAGLVALYDLDEGTGATIKDTSGVGTAVDLTVADPTRTSWVDGGLRFDQATVALSPGSGEKVSDAVKASGAMTIEAWVTPANVTQSGPAMIVSMAGATARNWALGQNGSSYSTKFRTSTTTADGEVATATPGAAASRQHVVYTRDAAGTVRVYVDGALVTSRALAGSLSVWVPTQRLSFGADRDGTKPWLGTLYTVALYSRALTATEVGQNFAAGEA
jgi:Concanavalin A-like lectin/glucanases superfamily/Chitobiase/beta-hexosaminidase C-terminal domain